MKGKNGEMSSNARPGDVLPKAVLLVENVGFYIDVTAPAGWMVVHVPGWNTATTQLLLSSADQREWPLEPCSERAPAPAATYRQAE